MIFILNIFFLIFLLPCSVYAHPPAHLILENIIPCPYKDIKVKVLLDEKQGHAAWVIENPTGIVICEASNSKKQHILPKTLNTIGFRSNFFVIDGKKLSETAIRVMPMASHLTLNGKTYTGSFLLYLKDNKCYLVNELDLEEYVCCVLNSESWPGWPLEVNKVFAIASRTYALHKILANKKQLYHIKNTNIHQTYNGFHTSIALKNAVEGTRGVILTYQKKPIIAMFDSCCGGIIPAHLSTIDFKKSPYLARTKVCNFCKPCKIFQWSWHLCLKEFEDLLQKNGFKVRGIKAIQTQKDKAGAVNKVIITSAGPKTELSRKQFYALSKKIKSFCYDIELKAKKIIVSGKGYGHHVGICQWGVKNMVDKGWQCREILQFFYPGTEYMKLKLE